MDRQAADRRAGLVLGGLLILAGAAALAAQTAGIDVSSVGWPLFVIVPGLMLFAVAVAVGGSAGTGLAIAGSITTTTGIILAVQDSTDMYQTWAYVWALVTPGAVGLGLLVYGAIIGDRDMIGHGRRSLAVGLVLFVVFGFFFEALIGLSGSKARGLDTILAAALVAAGVLIAGAGLFGRRPGAHRT